MLRRIYLVSVFAALFTSASFATLFAALSGVVHDPQHHPIQGASVRLAAEGSELERVAQSDGAGGFSFAALPAGRYRLSVTASSFARYEQVLELRTASAPIVHCQLRPSVAVQSVTVLADPSEVASDLATPVTSLGREQIAATPGAARANSLAMITDYVPGAYLTHDQLHVRGGHQTSWLIDGVPVPNTNIASNLGPQISPGDIDTLEVDRGSYGAEIGDRTYAAFNIVPRTGFERQREAELRLSAGNFNQLETQLSLGDHTRRFAWYASLGGNRSDLGLEPPVERPVHDVVSGSSGFGTVLFNATPSDQLRLILSARGDHYQIPYDPDPSDLENSGQYPSLGLRDSERESDQLAILSWVHTFSPRWMLTASPFFHRNRADYLGSPLDVPLATRQQRSSSYSGGQLALEAHPARQNLQIGAFAFYQRDDQGFGITYNDGSSKPPFADRERPSGGLASFFIDDKIRIAPGLVATLGLRPTIFRGGVHEAALSPRAGLTWTLPRFGWTVRGFYGHYYQAPPLTTVSGPLLALAGQSNTSFTALRGERDEEFQYGVAIPYRGWLLDADSFRTRATNFFDHNNLGESNLFFPVTIQAALIRGWELTLRSPRIGGRVQLHLAYSNQIATGGGAITGGLVDAQSDPVTWPVEFERLDHDQRHTLSLGGDVALPWQLRASTNLAYGSGFANAFPGAPYPGDSLPAHTTVDLSLGRSFGDRASLTVTALNLANRRVELDNSVTFGGFHWNNPRELFAELRYRFHF